MSIFQNILGNSVTEPLNIIKNILDEVITTDDEKLDKKIILERLAQKLPLIQAEINKAEATHKNIFVSGWRPFIGWTCGFSLFYEFLFRPFMNGLGCHFITIEIKELITLLIALLGMAGYRTYEKLKNVTK